LRPRVRRVIIAIDAVYLIVCVPVLVHRHNKLGAAVAGVLGVAFGLWTLAPYWKGTKRMNIRTRAYLFGTGSIAIGLAAGLLLVLGLVGMVGANVTAYVVLGAICAIGLYVGVVTILAGRKVSSTEAEPRT
jgi:hypothetical protein